MEVWKSVAKMMMGLTGLSVPGGGGAMAPTDFGGSANPTSNRGAIMPTALTLPPPPAGLA